MLNINKSIALLMLSLAGSVTAYAGCSSSDHVFHIYSGPTTCTGDIPDNITVNGKLTAYNANFSGNVTVNGSIDSSSSIFSSNATLKVSGTFSDNGSTFLGPVTVYGMASAANSHFNNSVSIASLSAYFTNTKLSDLTMLANGGSSQIVYLQKSSSANSVVFTNHLTEQNIVQLSQGSSVGTVVGGHIVHVG